MSLQLTDPAVTLSHIIEFVRETYARSGKTTGVIAVSGGIDSALALTILVKALGAEHVVPVLLPYGEQSMSDAEAIIQHLQIAPSQVIRLDIQSIVTAAAETLEVPTDTMRHGNLQARARMMAVFDIAKRHNALVCGTENKSEHYLGYFTRFGDAASDIEPITRLYKTQVRQVVEFLKLPSQFLSKAPSAGLWPGQTDEQEMGFSYEQADQVLNQLIDEQKMPAEITVTNVAPAVVAKVLVQVNQMQFKREVPYIMKER